MLGIWVALGTESYEQSTLVEAKTDKDELFKAVTQRMEVIRKERSSERDDDPYLGFSEVEIYYIQNGDVKRQYSIPVYDWAKYVTPEGKIREQEPGVRWIEG